MKKIAIFASAILILAALVPVLPTAEDTEIYDKTVRLHVIANSDSEEDQALKLKVRDSVLAFVGPLLANVNDRDEAEALLRQNLEGLQQAAQDRIQQEGYDYDVTLAFDQEYYPRKTYEALTLPAGHYLSMQVKIGENEGRNWWCVLFPMLCTTSAEPENELTQAGFTVNQIKLITDTDSTRYKIKFKFLEIFESLWQ